MNFLGKGNLANYFDPTPITYDPHKLFRLRVGIGVLAFIFPFILIGGIWLIDGELRTSISAYVHTGMGWFFTAVVIALGYFFLIYGGASLRERNMTDILGVLAFGVASFPIAEGSDTGVIVGVIHLLFALLFYGALGIYSLWVFPQISESRNTEVSGTMKFLYRLFGVLILLCVVSLIVDYFWKFSTYYALWAEIVANFLFSITWIIKGFALRKA